jgi:hypothetical protein
MPDKSSDNTRFLDLMQRFGRGSNRKKITLNRRVLTFFFFLLLSILFWFLTSMNKEYTAEISYPVRYIRFPEEKVLVNDIPDRLDLTVNASGYTLLSYRWRSRIAPIIFDVNSFSLNTMHNDPSTVYILSTYAKDRIAKQLSSEIQIIDINPDSLIFQFASRIEKFVPVMVNLDLEFEKQFMQVGPYKIDPDSILISGPELILDTISIIDTESFATADVSESFEKELSLLRINKVDMDPSEVWVQVPVEKYTEASIKVPIEVINLPDSLLLRAFPAQITVNFQVGLSAYESLNEHFFRAVVDFAEAGSMLGNKLQVRLDRMPEFIQSVNYTPKTVEYILEK